MSLKSVIAKMPIGIVRKTILTDTRAHLPAKIDKKELIRNCSNEINDANNFTNEKALYVASREKQEPIESVQQLASFKLFK